MPSYPSFSFLTSFLPPLSLPSLPLPSLPQNVQKRLLTFLLRKAIGSFLHGDQLDLVQEADIGNGSLKVVNLELAKEAIQPHLEGLPIAFESGTIGSVSAQVAWPLSLSATSVVAIELVDLDLAFRLDPSDPLSSSTCTISGHRKSTSDLSPSRRRSGAEQEKEEQEEKGEEEEGDGRMQESIISVAVANEFVKEELTLQEDADLRASLHLPPPSPSSRSHFRSTSRPTSATALMHSSILSDIDLPGAFNSTPSPPPNLKSTAQTSTSDDPDQVEVTILASLIERILERMNIRVKNIRIRLIANTEEEGDGEIELEFKVDEISYNDPSSSSSSSPSLSSTSTTPTRSIQITSPTLWLHTPTPTPPPPTATSQPQRHSTTTTSSPSSSSTSSSSSESSIDSDEITPLDDLAMSQSIADLRTSFLSTGSSRYDPSIYASATAGAGAGGLSAIGEGKRNATGSGSEEEEEEEEEEEDDNPFLDPENEVEVEKEKEETTLPPLAPPPAQPTTSKRKRTSHVILAFNTTSSQVEPITIYLSPQEDKRRKLRFQMSLKEPITILLRGTEVVHLLKVVGRILPSPESRRKTSGKEAGVEARKAGQGADVTVGIELKTVNVVLIYEDESAEERKEEEEEESLKGFWEHPTVFALPRGHLRMRIDGVAITSGGVTKGRGGSLGITIRNYSLLETTAEGRTFPIVVVDGNLARQYDLKSGSREGTLPSFETNDWTVVGGVGGVGEGRGWKAKAGKDKLKRFSAGGGGGGAGEKAEEVALTLEMSSEGKTTMRLVPIHVFLDLTLVERLLPFLASVLDALPSPSSEPLHATQTLASPSPSTPSARTPRPATLLSPHRILEDLAFEPLAIAPPIPRVRLEVEMIRVEVRCPAPGGDSTKPLRSGIALVDVHGLVTGLYGAEVEAETRVEWEKTLFLFAPATTTKAAAFLGISALPPDPRDHTPSSPILPSVKIRKVLIPNDLSASRSSLYSANSTSTAVECRVPLLKISLDKAVLDGLQLFADDLTQWAEYALGGASEGNQDDAEAKLVSSRYFGAKSYSRGRREASESEDSGVDGASQLTVKVAFSDVEIDLHVPTSSATTNSMGTTRHLRGLVTDVDLVVDLLRNDKNDLRVEAVVVDVDFREILYLASPRLILARTLPRNLASGSTPMVKIGFASSIEQETHLKESKVELTISNFTCYATADLTWLEELSLFAKAPEGAFETVVPNELTRLRFRISDGSIHLAPLTLESFLVLTLAEAKISTNLMPDMPRTSATIDVRDLRVMMIESLGDLREPSVVATQGFEYWRSKGFAQLANLSRASLILRQGNGLVLPDLELLLSDANLNLSICADSIAALSALAEDISTQLASSSRSRQDTPKKKEPPRIARPDLLASIDPTAFEQAKPVEDFPEYLDDDVPANLDYLAGTFRARSTIPKSTSSGKIGFDDGKLGVESRGQVISDVDGETIRMLDPRGLVILDDFLSVPRVDSTDEALGRPASLVRCRLSNCDVSIHIHEGFDWHTTRKAIEEEAKAVRRRLEKIRQLLAEGQTADESRDLTSTLVFGSVHLGLPPGSSELPEGQLLAAINDELDGKSEAPSDAESWQSLPGSSSSQKPVAVGRGRKSLTRSRAFAIEINLRGLQTSFDSFPTSHHLASTLRVDIDSFDIIDNIRTSTWRKFLTELRASDGGVVRASGASMVRLELDKVRAPMKDSSDSEEILMKIKISPLRLYIDQDALDFLKSFGAFKLPPPASTAAKTSETEPFFQRVEVMPVKIKLDYKPKRVDYLALKQGKTAELMNFFHFDGSEMTLRHLVVTGVSGSTRLSELVQDIWTPDVKANQLADVIAGIAPVRSVVNLSSGVANLVLLPLEQYKKDGRIARGLQRGASAFARSTTLEALNVGARLATGTQVILEQAEAVLGAKFVGPVSGEAVGSSAGPSDAPGSLTFTEAEIDEISRYAQQPNDLREGMEEAYKSLGDNFRSAAQTILAVPMEVYERSGNEGPVRAVIRAVPIAVLKPMIGASGAVSKALFGLRNSLDPDAQAEVADKYKTRPTAPE